MRTHVQARSEEETLGLQTQLETAGAEVERAHARLAALELEKERSAAQVCLVACLCTLVPFHKAEIGAGLLVEGCRLANAA